jgi:hypothetical protein
VRHLSSNRYAADVMQQHVSPIEPPQSIQENAVQPAQSAEATPAPPSSEEMASNPTEDYAVKILAADTTLDDETRANAWDLYHAAATPDELIRNLSPLEIPDTTRQTLLAAKQVTAAAVTPVEKAANALRQMANVDPQTLEVAETFPKLTKMVIDAAVRSEE